jgi:inosine-uridine nucleoside N-ribohydrolase
MKKKVIIDCDVGVDDALALILAFHSPELDIKAITAVNGNVPLPIVFNNIQKVLSLIKPENFPLIAKGADRPFIGKSVYAHSVHGEDGLGAANIPLPEKENYGHISPYPADELITKLARQYPGELTLIALGPLTNLALGLQRDRDGMNQLKEIIIMGGAVRTKGNITPYAEFNIFVDPLAGQMVFSSEIPVTLVPLDVTHQVYLTPQMMEDRIKPLQTPFSRFLLQATRYDFFNNEFYGGGKLFFLHDPLAVGVAIDSKLAKMEELSITVNVEEGERYGQILEVQKEKISETQKVNVCLKVNTDNFLSLFLSRIGA